MATADITTLDRLSKQAHHLADGLAKSERSAISILDSLKEATFAVTGVELIKSSIFKIIEQTTIYKNLYGALNAMSLSHADITERELNIINDINYYTELRKNATKEQKKSYTEIIEAANKQLNLIKHQKEIQQEFNRLKTWELGIATVLVATYATTWQNFKQFNKEIASANATFEYRYALLKNIYAIQAETGINFDRIVNAAEALVGHGLELRNTFSENLKVISMMQQSLGISAEQAAHLANIVERQLKIAFIGVANTITTIVNSTALLGQEVINMASNIGLALKRIQPAINEEQFISLLEYLGQYESKLKELGGSVGDLHQFLIQLTMPQGFLGAATLGVTPEFLASAEGVKLTLTRYAEAMDKFVGQTRGMERQLRLQVLSEIFGTSVDSLNQIAEAVRQTTADRLEQITVEQRWREQIKLTNQGFSRLWNVLVALLQEALLPVVSAVSQAINWIATLLKGMYKFKEVIIVGLWGAMIYTVIRLYKLIQALISTALAAETAAISLYNYSLTLGSKGGGLGRRRKGPAGILISKTKKIKTGIKRLNKTVTVGSILKGSLAYLKSVFENIKTFLSKFTSLSAARVQILNSLKTILTGVGTTLGGLTIIGGISTAIGWYMLKEIKAIKKLQEDIRQSDKIIMSMEQKYLASVRSRIFAEARYGEAVSNKAVLELYERAANYIATRSHQAFSTRRKSLEAIAEEYSDLIMRAKVTRNMWVELEKREPSKDILKEMLEVNHSIYQINKQMYEIIIKQIKEERKDKEADAEQKQRAEMLREFSRRPIYGYAY